MKRRKNESIEIVYYCMDHGEKSSIVVMLLTAEELDLYKLLKKEKRDTDILVEIDKNESLYAIICQDTQIDGGYHFAERILNSMKDADAKDIYCSALEVRTTRDDIRYIIFKLTEIFVKSRREGISGEIIFKSLN